MPRNKSKNSQQVVVIRQQPPKQKKRKQKRTRNTNKARLSNPYMRMLSEPCDSILTPGLYGDIQGLLSRHKGVIVPAEATTSGYLLWDPSGNTVAGDGPKSMFYWTNASASLNPLNTGASPFAGGAGLSPVTASYVISGSNTFTSGGVCSEFRTVSACLKMHYVGTTSNCAGRVAFVTSLPIETLVTGGSGGVPMSVNDVLAFTPIAARTTLDPMEVKFRPGAGSEFFKTDEIGALNTVAAAASTVSDNSQNFGTNLIGFAWSGIATSSFMFEVINNIEWKPDIAYTFAAIPQRSLGKSRIPEILAILDRYSPNWDLVYDMAGRVGSQMAQIAGAALAGSASTLAIANRRNLLAIRGG